MKQTLEIEMPDKTVWGVPVMIIARDRAKNYADEFGGDVEKSLSEDTVPLFEGDEFEIIDWAKNNMNWVDVKEHATKLRDTEPMTANEFQEGWVNGPKELV